MSADKPVILSSDEDEEKNGPFAELQAKILTCEDPELLLEIAKCRDTCSPTSTFL